MKKIFLFVGDPNGDTEHKSLSTLLADEYLRGAKDTGFEIRYTHLSSLQFDPVLHKGYRAIQALEPDLIKVQQDFEWADHIVVFHPVWWGSMPALLKAVFERMWMPHFAFSYWKEGFFKGLGWTKLLTGKSARIVQTSGSMPIILTILFGNPAQIMKRAIFWFSGIAPVYVTKFGPVERAPVKKVDKWKKKSYELGKKGK